MKPLFSAGSPVLIIALFLLFAGCSSFEKEWRHATGTASRGGVAKKWEGHWTSEKHHGMGGRLRCVLTRTDERHHRAWFRANWLTFASDYVVLLETRPTPHGLQLRGQHILHGFGGGLYRYEGSILKDQFRANYISEYDRGRFELQSVPSDSSRPQLTTRAPIQ